MFVIIVVAISMITVVIYNNFKINYNVINML